MLVPARQDLWHYPPGVYLGDSGSVTEEANSRRDSRDDVLVWRALGILAGRPDVGRGDRVLGAVYLGRLRPDPKSDPPTTRHRGKQRRGAHPGPTGRPPCD